MRGSGTLTAGRTLSLTGLAAVTGALAVGTSAQAPEATAQGGVCVPQIQKLSPKGGAAERYTLLLRINKESNVDEYAGSGGSVGGLRNRIRDHDIFVVNTRFKGGTPEEHDAIVARLRQRFPCNRIFALNGLGADPSQPGYIYALIDAGLSAVLLDWERFDWDQAREISPSMPPWTEGFNATRKRIGQRVSLVLPAGKAGVVPAYYSHWDYGLIGRTIDRRSNAAGRGLGFQPVQTQGACAAGGRAFKALTGRLLLQYKPKPRKTKKGKRKKVKPRANVRNLGLEVSFSTTPDPDESIPLRSVSVGLASKCTKAGLKRGGGAFLYWATPESVGALLDKRRICVLRPPPGGAGACP
jgi:hypothetical protein